jgi:hypothetical protein
MSAFNNEALRRDSFQYHRTQGQSGLENSILIQFETEKIIGQEYKINFLSLIGGGA